MKCFKLRWKHDFWVQNIEGCISALLGNWETFIFWLIRK